MRKWAVVVALMVLAGCASKPRRVAQTQPVAREQTAPATLAALAITAGPCLQAPTANTMTILWTTSRKCISRVEYGSSTGGPRQIAVSSRDGLINANTTLHSVTLTGLSPGSRYYYRVVSTEMVDFQPYKVVYGQTVRSEEASFVTLDPAKQKFSFVVVNDRHEKVQPLNQALGVIPWNNIDLAILNGDMLNHIETEEQILRGVIRPCTAAFATKVPFVYVRGNHETRGAFARELGRYVPSVGGRFYYAFEHGGVRFVVLDGGEDKADSSPEYSGLVDFEKYLLEETEWLKKELRSESFIKAKWRIVLLHIPPRNRVDPKFIREKYLLDRWVPLLNEAKVNLMLSGHLHRYIEVPPTPGENAFPILINSTDTIVRVDVTGEKLTLTTLANDGTVRATPAAVERR